MSYYNWKSKRSCVICGTTFEATRSDASFCSANCRKVASRQTAALKSTAKRAAQAIRDLEEYIKSDHRLKRDALTALENLAMTTSTAVNEHKGQRHIYQAGDARVTNS